MKKLFVVTSLCLLGVAHAQDAGTAPIKPIVETPIVPVTAPAGEWKANVGFSAILNTGNSENQTLGGNGLTSYKWDKNKLEGTLAGAYGRSKQAGVTQVSTKNWKATGRYDRYILDPLSLFLLGHVGQDKPAGFDSRYGVAGGFAHELLKTDFDFFKYEIGFDYTRENVIAAPDNDLYSERTFLQFKHKFSTYAEFGQDVEALFDLQHGKNVRLNTLSSLTAKLTDKVSFQVGFKVSFDNVPPPGKKKTDTSTQAGLVVTLL